MDGQDPSPSGLPTLIRRLGISIGTVHPGHSSWGYHESILHTLSKETRYTYDLISAESGVLIAGARNLLVERFLKETDDDYFLSIDSDIEWEPSAVVKLVEDDLPVVSGLYFGNSHSGELFPAFNIVDEKTHLGRQATLADVPETGGIVEVQGVGMGFCLIRREVLVALGTRMLWPFEEILYQKQPTGEDVTFCIRAKSKGYKSYVDLDARVGHRKEVVL